MEKKIEFGDANLFPDKKLLCFHKRAAADVEIGDDSEASNAINKGLSYEPENIELVELAVWNSKRMNDKDSEIENLPAAVVPTAAAGRRSEYKSISNTKSIE